jgi:type II secretory pathway pseudopilin PulG
MDWLALFVIVAIVGQLALILWLRSRHTLDARQLAQQRARLLEDAAHQQAVTFDIHKTKLGHTEKGVVDAD